MNNSLVSIINKLLPLLEAYDKGNITPQIRGLSEIREILDEEAGVNEVSKYIRDLKSLLYPPKGGLTDFFVWEDDYQKRIKINTEIDELNTALWNCLNKISSEK